LKGKIPLTRFSDIMPGTLGVIKSELYKSLSKKDQTVHEYLLNYAPPQKPKV